MLRIEMLVQASGVFYLRIERVTNINTDNSTVFPTSALFYWTGPTSGGPFTRWRDDGSFLYADVSADGANWTQLYTEPVGTFIPPTAYGFGGIEQTTGQVQDAIYVLGWLATNSAAL